MAELDTFLRAARQIEAPDLWQEIDERSRSGALAAIPRSRIVGGRGRRTGLPRADSRLIAVVVAATLSITSTVLVVRTLHFERGIDEPAAAGTMTIAARIPVESGPTTMAFGDGSAWVTSAFTNVVQRIDPTTNTVVATIPAFGPNDSANEMAYSGSIWVSAEKAGLVRIDPQTNTVAARWGFQADFIDWSRGAVWVSSPERGRVVRIDPATDRVVAAIPVAGRPTGLLATDWAVWVVNDDPGSSSETLTQIDPRTNTVVRVVQPRGEIAEEIVWTPNDLLWVAACIRPTRDAPACAWSSLALDSRTGEIVHRRSGRVPGEPFDMHTADGGRLWGAIADYYTGIRPNTGTVFEVDPETGRVLRSIDVGTMVTDVTYGAGSIWAAERGSSQVVRIDPGP
jgi:DNA-binding beta-propeller fold protein YncE